ncbi:conserved domain protein [Peptoniphilus sp. oral taxon 375 str. F0436]|nr:conserved domain protein [Peptoniphilus sp. oral taxon 375 str. F0436]
MEFKVHAPFEPMGDQPQAIDQLAQGIVRGDKHQTLKGVTGPGRHLPWPRSLKKFKSQPWL